MKYETLREALDAAKDNENIVVELLADAVLDVTAWSGEKNALSIGSANTETITINGNSHQLTFNNKNSDWNNIATMNDAETKLVLNNMSISNSGYNNGPWNRHDINFNCAVELNNVTSDKALAFKNDASLKNVTVTETGDVYAIWVQPHGQNISIDGLTKAHQPIMLKMASSFTDRVGCERNLAAEAEGKTFEQMQTELADQWIARLHTIDIDDPNTARVNQFYGALYRTSFLPREFSDVDGRYPRFASQPTEPLNLSTSQHLNFSTSPQKFFTDFSMWDTYRAVHPLYNIIAPTLSAQMMQSLVTMAEQGGWMPIFPCWNSYTAAMIGDHCSISPIAAACSLMQLISWAKTPFPTCESASSLSMVIWKWKTIMKFAVIPAFAAAGTMAIPTPFVSV